MTVCFFGAFDPSYPRTAILRRGLKINGQAWYDWRLPAGLKAWARYPLGLAQALVNQPQLGKMACLFVPSFGHKDVPLAYLLSRKKTIPLIFDPLASRYETKILDWRRKPPDSLTARWNYFLDKLSFRLADLVLADTRAHRDYYCQEFGLEASRVAILPVGFDDSLWSARNENHQEEKKPFTVVFFGSFLPLHGVEEMARAALIAIRREPSMRFLFIGSGQTFPLVSNLLMGERSGRIQLLGWMRERQLVQLIRREAHVCFGLFGPTPKASRVVPHKIFQAMALGKAVITLDTPAIREFFTHGENIYLCPSAEPEAIAHGLIELYSQPEMRQKIAENSRQLVYKKFNPQALGKTFISLIEARFNLKS